MPFRLNRPLKKTPDAGGLDSKIVESQIAPRASIEKYSGNDLTPPFRYIVAELALYKG